MGTLLAGLKQLTELKEKQQNWALVKIEGQLRRSRWQGIKSVFFWALVFEGSGVGLRMNLQFSVPGLLLYESIMFVVHLLLRWFIYSFITSTQRVPKNVHTF